MTEEELIKIRTVIDAIDDCDGVIIPYSICKKMFDVADLLKVYVKQEELINGNQEKYRS